MPTIDTVSEEFKNTPEYRMVVSNLEAAISDDLDRFVGEPANQDVLAAIQKSASDTINNMLEGAGVDYSKYEVTVESELDPDNNNTPVVTISINNKEISQEELDRYMSEGDKILKDIFTEL